MFWEEKVNAKTCKACGKGTVKPERLVCKHCGSNEWLDRKGRPIPVIRQHRPDGSARWGDKDTALDWASEPMEPQSPRQKILADRAQREVGGRTASATACPDLRTTRTGRSDLDERLARAKTQLQDLNAQAAKRGETISRTQEASRELADNARGFASGAKSIRQKMEARNASWF